MPSTITSAHITAAEIPWLVPHANSIQSKAMSEPTEISMPPVSITQVMPQATHTRPALLFKMFKNVCAWVKPLLAYTTQPAAYITTNKTTVITSSRVLLFIFFEPKAFAVFCSVFIPWPPPYRLRERGAF